MFDEREKLIIHSLIADREELAKSRFYAVLSILLALFEIAILALSIAGVYQMPLSIRCLNAAFCLGVFLCGYARYQKYKL